MKIKTNTEIESRMYAGGNKRGTRVRTTANLNNPIQKLINRLVKYAIILSYSWIVHLKQSKSRQIVSTFGKSFFPCQALTEAS